MVLQNNKENKEKGVAMKISIIGGGAIGLLCAAYLAPKHDVTVFVRTENQKAQLREKGLTLFLANKEERHYFTVDVFENWDGEGDLSIITVKQYQLLPVLKKVTELSSKISALLFLQNGMTHLDALKNLAVEELYVGVVEHGVLKLDGTTIRHTGIGKIQIASLPFKEQVRASSAGTLLVQDSITGFNVQMQTDPIWMMQKKLVVNCLVNTLTSILEVNNGQLLDNPHYKRLLAPFLEEITETLGWNQQRKDICKQYVWKVIEQTAANKSSMLKDIEAGRDTEIDAILGYVLDIAAQTDSYVPLCAAYYEMLKGKEQERKEGI